MDGALDPGETLRAATIREAREEIGVRIPPDALVLAHTIHSLTEGQDWVGHFFVADQWSGEPRICEPDKHGDLRWCAVEALPAETIPYVRQALIAMSRGERYSEFGWLLNPPG